MVVRVSILGRAAAGRAYHAFLAVPAAAGFFDLWHRLHRDKALIVMYHGVLPAAATRDLHFNNNHVSTDSFEWQLRFLRDRYTLVPLSEILRRLRDGAPVGGLAAVTFDDGYLSIYEHAASILFRLGIPATVFLIAGLVGSGCLTWYDRLELLLRGSHDNRLEVNGRRYHFDGRSRDSTWALKTFLKTLPPDERDDAITRLFPEPRLSVQTVEEPFRLMDWPQVLELHRRGLSFGVHSYSHPNLSRVPALALAREIDAATRIVADRLSMSVAQLCFSYPDGDFNLTIRNHVEGLGLLGAVAVIDDLVRPGSDPFTVPRVGIYSNYSQAMFRDSTVGFTRHLKRFRPSPLSRFAMTS
jgi:peptidoglycan/xylan/chitin deacetylase (PgdA/CDA1 family)